MTIEENTSPQAIWQAVEEAIRTCGPHGGFILSPVDNLINPSAQARENLLEFIRAWRQMRDITALH
jgi:hypothetical protein